MKKLVLVISLLMPLIHGSQISTLPGQPPPNTFNMGDFAAISPLAVTHWSEKLLQHRSHPLHWIKQLNGVCVISCKECHCLLYKFP